MSSSSRLHPIRHSPVQLLQTWYPLSLPLSPSLPLSSPSPPLHSPSPPSPLSSPLPPPFLFSSKFLISFYHQMPDYYVTGTNLRWKGYPHPSLIFLFYFYLIFILFLSYFYPFFYLIMIRYGGVQAIGFWGNQWEIRSDIGYFGCT